MNKAESVVGPKNKKGMPETMYRASRYFRVLGNPTAYRILRSLGKGRKTPSELSRELNMPVQTISGTLRNMRQVDLVRYQAKWKSREYWIKDRGVLGVLKRSEALVEKMRKKKE